MKKRYIIVIGLICAIIGVINLGLTRQYVVNAAGQIIAKDKVGDPVDSDITQLTNYVHSHTRASVSFSLAGSYERAVQAAEQAAAPSADPTVYAAAQAACQVKNPVATANCIETYVQTHAAPGAQPHPAVLPDFTKFTYNLTAPAWAPDIAGISLLASVVSLVLTLWFWLFRHATKPSY